MISYICDGLYIGETSDILNIHSLIRLGINVVFAVAYEPYPALCDRRLENMVFIAVPIDLDSSLTYIRHRLRIASYLLRRLLNINTPQEQVFKIIIYCTSGLERSPAVAALALEGLTINSYDVEYILRNKQEACDFVNRRRPESILHPEWIT